MKIAPEFLIFFASERRDIRLTASYILAVARVIFALRRVRFALSRELRIIIRSMSGIPRREHRPLWALFTPLNDVGGRRVRVRI